MTLWSPSSLCPLSDFVSPGWTVSSSPLETVGSAFFSIISLFIGAKSPNLGGEKIFVSNLQQNLPEQGPKCWLNFWEQVVNLFGQCDELLDLCH